MGDGVSLEPGTVDIDVCDDGSGKFFSLSVGSRFGIPWESRGEVADCGDGSDSKSEDVHLNVEGSNFGKHCGSNRDAVD